MYKNKTIRTIILLILLITIVSVLISASSAARVEPPTEKIDSGKKIIKVNNEKYTIKWKTHKVVDIYEKEKAHKLKNNAKADNSKRYVYIDYKSMKNKKNKGHLHITLYKTGKNKMKVLATSSLMNLDTSKTIKAKASTHKYYLKKLRPNIGKVTKNLILNKVTLRYDKNRYFNKTIKDPTTNETVTAQYKMNWKVYYHSKTSSIEIVESYIGLNNLSKNHYSTSLRIVNPNKDIRIDKHAKGKLKISILPTYTPSPYDESKISLCGGGPSINYKYVKTKLSPKQYYLKIYKKDFETKKLK